MHHTHQANHSIPLVQQSVRSVQWALLGKQTVFHAKTAQVDIIKVNHHLRYAFPVNQVDIRITLRRSVARAAPKISSLMSRLLHFAKFALQEDLVQTLPHLAH